MRGYAGYRGLRRSGYCPEALAGSGYLKKVRIKQSLTSFQERALRSTAPTMRGLGCLPSFWCIQQAY